MPPQDNSRNTIIFVVIAAIMLMAYSYFVMQPQAERRKAAQQAAVAEQTSGVPVAAASPGAVTFTTDRTVALARGGARVPIKTDTVTGSLSLRGARIDDLFLTRYQ
ncbi:MAG TPA: membrane protein insertase YidC, partial [Brevundimonas sp.]|nr:membrane protein insertase YidC [Brevundimonas sp.]